MGESLQELSPIVFITDKYIDLELSISRNYIKMTQ